MLFPGVIFLFGLVIINPCIWMFLIDVDWYHAIPNFCIWNIRKYLQSAYLLCTIFWSYFWSRYKTGRSNVIPAFNVIRFWELEISISESIRKWGMGLFNNDDLDMLCWFSCVCVCVCVCVCSFRSSKSRFSLSQQTGLGR